MRWFTLVLLAFAGVYALAGAPKGHDAGGLDRIVGTWTGESICVGNGSACHNEVAVYRIEPISEGSVMLFGDKIIDGKRLPMGKFTCKWDAKSSNLSAEFQINQTHGLWSFHLSGEVLDGTLVSLPGKELRRRVKVHRVTADKVPAAPPDSDYEP